MNKDLKDKTLEELEKVVIGLGQKKYLAGYLFKFIHVQNGREIAALSTLSKAFRTQLVEQGYFISQLKIVDSLTDPDGSAKYLFELADGERIETVLLPEEERKTLCVSTQVGCPMGCAFCATGRIQFRRNLTAGEIVDQVNTVEEHAGRITNLVYMGMGEPLLNYDAVLKSIRILNHSAGKNIGIRHITISTSGIVPGIRQLAEEEIRPRLAISLSAPTDALRSKLMPVTDKYPIAELLEAVRAYQAEDRPARDIRVRPDRQGQRLRHARAPAGQAPARPDVQREPDRAQPLLRLRIHRQQPGANPALRRRPEGRRRGDDDPLSHGPADQSRLRPAPGRLPPARADPAKQSRMIRARCLRRRLPSV